MQTKIAIINRQLKVNNHIQYTVKKTYIVSPYNIMEKELANVDKIKRANGLSSNNIHNGQTLVIPQ